MYDIEETSVDDTTRFLGAKTAYLYGWWRQAGGGRPPLKRLFDIVEHRLIVQNLFLVEAVGDGFLFKLNGEETVFLLGENPMGRMVRAYSIENYGFDLEEYYRSVAASRACCRCAGRLRMTGKSHFAFESIDCPLAGPDGSITHILGAMQLVDRPDGHA